MGAVPSAVSGVGSDWGAAGQLRVYISHATGVESVHAFRSGRYCVECTLSSN
eukprot:NODE_16619_length_202_cov_5.457516_g15705_i0.p3 GENE.NODE_16619_length_202_cov_5.457516_g15705_i0~~NODE_16619_length_202_cov_5.457516_g15705_i0.p3  ORF type:complete len:61 (+),score=17.41 NODE_16619_length_202_cov_5.457516_g15705_i0:28-183(+)